MPNLEDVLNPPSDEDEGKQEANETDQEAQKDEAEEPDSKPLTAAEADKLRKDVQKGLREAAERKREAEQLAEQAREVIARAQAQQTQPPATDPYANDPVLGQLEPDVRQALVRLVRQEAGEVVKPLTQAQERARAEKAETTLSRFFDENPDLDTDAVMDELVALWPSSIPDSSQLERVLPLIKAKSAPTDPEALKESIRAEVLAELAEQGAHVKGIKKAGKAAEAEPGSIESMSDEELRKALL